MYSVLVNGLTGYMDLGATVRRRMGKIIAEQITSRDGPCLNVEIIRSIHDPLNIKNMRSMLLYIV